MKIIECPACGQLQTFVFEAGVWFQQKPYCCEVMEYRDTAEWNDLLDRCLKKAINITVGLRSAALH
jgi:hypothetical protein